MSEIVIRQMRRYAPVSDRRGWTSYPERSRTAMTVALQDLVQERRLVTELPGPRSRELFARRQAVVSSGVGTTFPVFIERAGGGVLLDVDGNSLIDLGSG